MTDAVPVDVPVAGGTLRAFRWGDAPTVVLAAHGITANHRSWAMVAEALGPGISLVAPDLRGRGASATLPGPFGMAAHADDVVAVADHLGVERFVLAGHSMGGYVGNTAAVRHPERVAALVLVDGGVSLPVQPGLDVDAVLDAVVGPSIARLRTTFPSRQAYLDQWKAHPALGAYWNDAIEDYVMYDLAGEEPELRSVNSLDAVRADGADVLTEGGSRDDQSRLEVPAVLLRAERGMLDTPTPLLPDELVAAVLPTTRIVDLGTVPDTNHFTITMSRSGAAAVAEQIMKAVAQ